MLVKKIEEEELSNVYGIVGKAEELLDMFEDGEISKIYLNFSTPWPKKRHNKRRLSHENFLKLYQVICKRGQKLSLRPIMKTF